MLGNAVAAQKEPFGQSMQLLIGAAPPGLHHRPMGSQLVTYAPEPDATGNRPTLSDKLPGYNLYSVVNTGGDPTLQIGGGTGGAPTLSLSLALPGTQAKVLELAVNRKCGGTQGATWYQLQGSVYITGVSFHLIPVEKNRTWI